jgi:hypothetical protein
MPLPRATATVGLLFGLLLLPAWAAAQAGPSASCPAGRIATIFVDNHSVFDLSNPKLDPRLGWAYRLANRLHVPTREEVLRREILVKEGDCYDEEMVRESARVLRASPYLAAADVYGIRQPGGSWHVVVDTRDDWSTRVEPRVGSNGGMRLTGLVLRDDNMLGYGRQVAAFYRETWDERMYGASYATPQLLDTRWDAAFAGGKTPTGFFAFQSLSYPFVGDRGRWALREQFQHEDRYFRYAVPTDLQLVDVLLPERRRRFDLGAVYRFGRRTNVTMLGGALAGEWIAYPAPPRFARAEGAVAGDSLLGSVMRLDSVASVRALLLAGKRNVRFVPRRAFDSVRGTEDVRLGFEAELGVGRSIPGLSNRDDISVESGLFAAAAPTPRLVTGAYLLFEGKKDLAERADRTEWSDLFAELDAWAYLRPAPESRHTTVVSLRAAGGWNTTVPYQLTLGADAGLRGYPSHLDPGGRRLIVSLEQRSYLGWPYPDLFDLGVVAFADVGKMWAGDAAFGTNSPVRADVGVGLRAALPPGSRNTFRLDVGVPVRAGVGFGDVVVSVGVAQAIGLRGLRRDAELTRSSRRTFSTSLFNYPDATCTPGLPGRAPC